MALARMGVWGKGRQSVALPQHAVTPEREQRFGPVHRNVNTTPLHTTYLTLGIRCYRRCTRNLGHSASNQTVGDVLCA